MTPSQRWLQAMGGMVFGYWVAGPLGGFAGLGAGWWWGAQPAGGAKSRREALPPRLADAYRTLGVSPGDDADTIKAAYRRLINRHHPDKLPVSADTVTQRTAGERTTAIRQAYERIQRQR